MNKPASLALLVVGVILIIYGMNSSNSVGSSFSKAFTGAPTDKTIWLIVAGVICGVTGLIGVVRGGTKS